MALCFATNYFSFIVAILRTVSNMMFARMSVASVFAHSIDFEWEKLLHRELEMLLYCIPNTQSPQHKPHIHTLYVRA